MLDKRLSLVLGTLLGVLSIFGYLAINMDSSRYLGNASLDNNAGDSSIFFQQTSTGLSNGVSFNLTLLNNTVQALIQKSFPPSAPRIETHIFVDRLVYTSGDPLFLNVLVNDAFTKNPLNVQANDTNLENYKVMVDLYDNRGILVWSDEQYATGTSANFFTLLPPVGLTTGTYTLRAYGPVVAPSYRQIRVIGDINGLSNDFMASVSLDKSVYIAGQTVFITVSVPLTNNLFNASTAQNFSLSLRYGVEFENYDQINGMVPVKIFNGTLSANANFTIPMGTMIRQNFLSVAIEADQIQPQMGMGGQGPMGGQPPVGGPMGPPPPAKGRYLSQDANPSKLRSAGGYKANGVENLGMQAPSDNGTAPSNGPMIPVFQQSYLASYILPLNIRSRNISTVFWTESFAPLVVNTTQKVYFYNYFGEPSEALTERSYLYPFLGSVNVTTVQVNGKNTTTNTTVLVSSYYGTGSFEFTTKSLNITASTSVKSPDNNLTLTQPASLMSLQSNLLTSNQEITFGLVHNIVNNTNNLTVLVQTNALGSNSAVYILQVVHKERTVWQNAFNFSPSSNTTINIPASQLPACTLGCNQQVVLYRVTPNYTAFQMSNNTKQQQNLTTVLSWLQIKGTQPVYRMSTQTPLTVTVTSDKSTYAPSDLVNLNVVVKNATANSTFINLVVVDENSNQGFQLQDSQLNINGRLIENEFLALGIPVYDNLAVFAGVKSSPQALDAFISSQLLRTVYTDFLTFPMLQSLSPSALLGDIFSVQRYFGSSLNISVAQTYQVRPFTVFSNVFNNVDLGIGSRLVDPTGSYQQEQADFGQDLTLPYLHPFNQYYSQGAPNDFTQTVAFVSAQMLVNGTYQTSFFLNDFQTTYSVYAEAYTTSGLAGSTVARQSLSTMKSNPNFQSLSTSMISLNSFLVANDSIIVTSKFQNSFNFPLEIETFPLVYYDQESLNFTYQNYSIAPGQSENISATINVLNDANGDQIYFSLVALAVNQEYNISIWIEQDFFVSLVNNAVQTSVVTSGLIGTNFTGHGYPNSSMEIDITLPNANYYNESVGIAQVYGINEDLLSLFAQAQLFKLQNGQVNFFQDNAALTYIAAKINAYLENDSEMVPEEVLQELQGILYYEIQQVFPMFLNTTDGGFREFPQASLSNELLTAQALIYLSLIEETFPDALVNTTGMTNGTTSNVAVAGPLRILSERDLKRSTPTNTTNTTQPPATNTTLPPATTNAPSGNQTTRAPSGNSTTLPPPPPTTGAPSGNQTTRAPSGNQTTVPPPPTNGTHPSGNQTTMPPPPTNGTRPSGNQTTQPPQNNGSAGGSHGSTPPANPTILDAVSAFIIKRRNATGAYNIVSNQTNQAGFPSNPLLVQAYINYAVSKSVLAKKYTFTAELNYLMKAINANLTSTTSRTHDPLILSLAAIAFANFGNSAYAETLVSYLKQYQSPSGALNMPTSYLLAGQTLFGSSPRDAQVILAAYAAQAFEITGNHANAILADQFISTQVTIAGLFGGNQATIVASSTIIDQLDLIRTQTDDARFGIFLNNVRVSKSFPYEQNEMGILTTITMDGPQDEGLDQTTVELADLVPGATVQGKLEIIGTQPTESVDFGLGYWFGAVYESTAIAQTSPNSPLFINVTQNYKSGQLGNASMNGQNVQYNVSVKNTGKANLGDVLVTFRIPSCLMGTPDQNQQLQAQAQAAGYDPSSGEVYIVFNGIAPSATRNATLNLVQSNAGVCHSRHVTAQVLGDDSSVVSVKYLQ